MSYAPWARIRRTNSSRLSLTECVVSSAVFGWVVGRGDECEARHLSSSWTVGVGFRWWSLRGDAPGRSGLLVGVVRVDRLVEQGRRGRYDAWRLCWRSVRTRESRDAEQSASGQCEVTGGSLVPPLPPPPPPPPPRVQRATRTVLMPTFLLRPDEGHAAS